MANKIDAAIIVGSGSDLPMINETVKTLKEFGLSYSLNIASAHRASKYLKQCIQEAEDSGVKAFIAAAGMAAALPGVIASETVLPVIGVPIDVGNLSSFDSLFSIVQMPKGVPVATVALGRAGAVNAALLAVQIIAVADENLREKLKVYRNKMADAVVNEDLKLRENGIEKYIERLKK
ncbi:MAG: 5-(carboxyamino)imidazole ribonucleotide mutase [Endomicrobium sp.]|jgi:5-(carboxyamino)imidazole ribonucleotide mutase|nr:5-(carboxyamino)imidazole ribonucleotide mutase [Endomicrobium sp.]